jgi:hypothetical protein
MNYSLEIARRLIEERVNWPIAAFRTNKRRLEMSEKVGSFVGITIEAETSIQSCNILYRNHTSHEVQLHYRNGIKGLRHAVPSDAIL